jgi:hypothetical protein
MKYRATQGSTSIQDRLQERNLRPKEEERKPLKIERHRTEKAKHIPLKELGVVPGLGYLENISSLQRLSGTTRTIE